MKIRALFLDIDGTLLNSSHLIGAATRQRLLSFQKQGGKDHTIFCPTLYRNVAIWTGAETGRIRRLLYGAEWRANR